MSVGVRPPSNKEGVLQDVHWSGGAFGYFPSYSLGAMIAAQLFEKATEDIPDLSGKIERGEFKELKNWLNTNIHESVRKYVHLTTICRGRRMPS